MSAATIDQLRAECAGWKGHSAEYVAKQVHPVPRMSVVDRRRFILDRCANRVVLDIGASGAMHQAIAGVARTCYGIDRPSGPAVVVGPAGSDVVELPENVVGVDIDDVDAVLPRFEGVEVIVCGEVLEHLSNPGAFLQRLREAYPGVPVVITVPNAFSDQARRVLERDQIETVNKEHRCWYSWRTLTTLVVCAGYQVKESYWYNGRPLFAEGLIFVVA